MTGFRIGWVCGNKDAIAAFGKLKTTIDTGLFKAIQKCAADILNSTAGDDYIKTSNKDFIKKLKIVYDGFKELGWNISSQNIPNATFYVLL